MKCFILEGFNFKKVLTQTKIYIIENMSVIEKNIADFVVLIFYVNVELKTYEEGKLYNHLNKKTISNLIWCGLITVTNKDGYMQLKKHLVALSTVKGVSKSALWYVRKVNKSIYTFYRPF